MPRYIFEVLIESERRIAHWVHTVTVPFVAGASMKKCLVGIETEQSVHFDAFGNRAMLKHISGLTNLPCGVKYNTFFLSDGFTTIGNLLVMWKLSFSNWHMPPRQNGSEAKYIGPGFGSGRQNTWCK
mmetsp:Transcript_5592/g.8572  ORF Transcript_5592/g.8572 Transcript_5592/m.8572 type:complete len:127 (+) Transcript_5592:275-655(+)